MEEKNVKQKSIKICTDCGNRFGGFKNECPRCGSRFFEYGSDKRQGKKPPRKEKWNDI